MATFFTQTLVPQSFRLKIGWSKLILVSVAIFMSTNVFAKSYELVPQGKVLALITKEEAAELQRSGVDLFDEGEARAFELCALVDKSLYSLTFVQYGINIKKEHIVEKNHFVRPVASYSEYIRAAGFVFALACGVLVVLPSSLCDIYCPASYDTNARIGALIGLSGMIGGLAASVASEFSEDVRTCCKKLEETDDDSFTCSDSDEEKSDSPDPVLVKSLKCV